MCAIMPYLCSYLSEITTSVVYALAVARIVFYD